MVHIISCTEEGQALGLPSGSLAYSLYGNNFYFVHHYECVDSSLDDDVILHVINVVFPYELRGHRMYDSVGWPFQTLMTFALSANF